MYLKIHDIKLEMETISPLDPRGKVHRRERKSSDGIQLSDLSLTR